MGYCKVNNTWKEITAAYKKESGEWVVLTEEQLSQYINSNIIMYREPEPGLVVHTLMIGGPSNCIGETGTYMSIYDGRVVTAGTIWSVVSGSSYATVSQTGELTILEGASASSIIIGVEYNGLSAIKNIAVTYEAGTTSETETETEVETNESGQTITTTTTTTTTTDASGNITVTETITQIVENEDGSLSSIAQETETGSDGTVTSNTTTVNYDENGDLTGSQTNATVENPDGSSTNLTTNFDENGNATDSTNLSGDTEGNISTQQVEYDESGTPIVTGFQIDTSNGSDGNKNFNADGVNTDYYAFDVTTGFELIMHFTINFNNQPANQDQNHHQILTMKRADPAPWYGFQLRQSKTNNYIHLGTQFSGGSNTNTSITGAATASANTAEYNLKITYDPRLSTNSFVCRDLLKNQNVYTSNLKFPDLEELRYIKVTIGYAMQPDGTPYRYSNINVIEFSIEKILYPPVISYEENVISIALNNSKGDIYYKLNQTGNYLLYTSPISIKRDTVVESYVGLYNRTSNIASATCVYESIVTAPIINYDYNNHIIELSCETEGADIYYDLNHTGNYTLYTSAITITATTYVEAYAYLAEDDLTSTVVSTTCVRMYDPTIECDGEFITITTTTQSAETYYKLGQDASYTLYESPIQISADTITYAYSSFSGYSSNIVSANCIWDVDISAPVANFNHNVISLNCNTFGANIYYKFNVSGNYELYSEPLEINEDTTVFAFAELNGESSTTISQLFIYTHYYDEDYLTFNILSSGTINWMSKGNVSIANIQYSINGGQWTWTSITDRNVPEIISVNEGDSIRFKGNNSRYGENNNDFNTFSGGTAIFNIEGNIMSLIYGDDFIGKTTFSGNPSYIFGSLLRSTNIISAEHLILPATSLNNNCYQNMFNGCTLLTTAPELPATTLASSCYYEMFSNCKSLIAAPELPATTLVENCYNVMFNNCTALTTVQSALPATTLANGCYGNMFRECKSLTTAPELPATALPPHCYNSMFFGCTSLIAAPEIKATTVASHSCKNMFNGCTALTTVQSALPATTLAESCYNSMFSGCTSLTAAPEIKATTVATSSCTCMFAYCTGLTTVQSALPATTLANSCYENMFLECKSLTTAPELPATTLADRCYFQMFTSCTGLTTVQSALPATTLAISCYESMFRNCKSLITAPELPATTLTKLCYRYMFHGCKSLITASEIKATTVASGSCEFMFSGCTALTTVQSALPATTLAVNCYHDMFNGCSSLNTAPEIKATTLASYSCDGMFFNCTGLTTVQSALPATTLAEGCYRNMFNNCKFTTAPALPATTLAKNCYKNMFTKCNSLVAAPELPATTLFESVYFSMFNGCTSLTTAPELPATTLGINCYNQMFNDCTALTTVQSALPATTLADGCYNSMFKNCKSITTAPELPATTLAEGCYNGMFSGCSNLNYIKCMATSADTITITNWTRGVSNTGVFVRNIDTTWSSGGNGIPNGWTVYSREALYAPVISCNNGVVEITCTTSLATIYYRLNNEGDYSEYTSAITITATTIFESYSELDGIVSDIVSAICANYQYLTTPAICCDGKEVFITNSMSGLNHYYKFYEDVNYTLYTGGPISLSADTVIMAYSEYNGVSSDTVSDLCIYDEGYNYEQDYLTFRILSDGVINWKLIGTASALTIQYSKNGGEWTSITANATPATISVVEGDVLRFKGENSYYSVSKTAYNGFYEGTATYNAEGNIMSLVYGDNFVGQKALTTNWEFANLFNHSKLVSAKNLVMPATALTNDCYRAMFANSSLLTIAPALPATTLSTECYYYMFDWCVSMKKAPDLMAPTIGNKSYFATFHNCTSLSYINCLWTNPSTAHTADFTSGVSTTGIFVKYPTANWTSGGTGIPSAWTIYNYGEEIIESPVIDYANNEITITCNPECVDIFYRLNQTGNYTLYSSPISITGNTVIETYSKLNNTVSHVVSATCMFIDVSEPVINCDGEYVTITNEMSSTDTYYKLNQDSGYTLYSIPLEISADTIVYAYSDLNGLLSDVVSSNCEYYITLRAPVIDYNFNTIAITCKTPSALVYYKLNELENYNLYSAPIEISADTTVFTYSELSGESSTVISGLCTYVEYDDETLLATSNRSISSWTYNNQDIVTPYSVNAINGHTSAYTKGTYNFTTSVELSQVQPTYLWFQHADQSADIFVDDVKVETHWGGYNAFFSDITNFVHSGTNNIKVALCNTTRNTLAPAEGDFNFNATLGNVKLLTSPVLPSMEYGYDGFHVTSDVSDSSATITVKTTIPLGAEVKCSIDDNQYHFVDAQNSTGEEMIFSATVQNPHLWNGKADPHLYNIKLEIYYNGNLYHRFERGYGLRYYSYVINDTSILPNNESYTGFLLNGTPYLLRGVCMHDDIEGKANALTSGDVETTFAIIQELGCNFIRLAHYPHPKEVYDKCDELGIVVQTEVPCVNKLQSSMPSDYYTHLTGQYEDMVNQHYNHPCIMFWGLSNETTTDDKPFGKAKIEEYTALIKSLDSERLVGYVMSHSFDDPYGYYNNPDGIDWVGCNIYVGWYVNQNSNNPTSYLNSRVTKAITNKGKALAFSEYGCGGTQRCHSETPQTTTTKGNYERHDIEYQMWLHEGHIAAIKNFPNLLFAAQWQLFDIAVSKRKEGYIICPDGETTSTDENLKYLNNKGLVERDHTTKKDTFYLYKAEWSDDIFVHICGKDYTRMVDRVIKCYTNNGNSLSLYVNDTFIETVNVTDHIATFTSRTFYSGDIVRVEGATTNDTFTFA